MVDFFDWDVLVACGNKRDRYILFDYFDQRNCRKLRTAGKVEQLDSRWHSDGFNTLVIELAPPWVDNLEGLQTLRQRLTQPARLFGLVTEKPLAGSSLHLLNEVCDGLLFSPMSVHAIEYTLNQTASANPGLLPPQKESMEKQQGLWEVFFEESAIPQLIVNAQSRKITHVNEAFCQLVKETDEAILGRGWHHFDRTHTVNDYDQYEKVLNSQGHVKFQFKLARDIGDVARWVQVRYQIIVLDGKPVYLGQFQDHDEVATFSRVMEYIRQLQAVQQRTESVHRLCQQVSQWLGLDCLVVARLDNDDETGQPEACTSPSHWDAWQSSRHGYLMRQLRKGQVVEIETEAASIIPSDTWLTKTRAQSVWSYPFIDPEGIVRGFLFASANTPRQSWAVSRFLLSELAAHLAKNIHIDTLHKLYKQEGQHDPLTGLPNRLLFIRELEQRLEKARRDEHSLAIVFLDLDKFKNINDSLGHDIGDEVLLTVTQLLRKSLGDHGVLARFAGDEFTIIIDPVESRDAVIEQINDIRRAMRRPLLLSNGSELLMSLSIGVSFFPEHGKTVNTLLKNADLAMYDAKLGGRNRVKVYEKTEDSGEIGRQKLELESQLRQSIEHGQLQVFYQPKIEAVSEAIVGFEALVRWQHPELGLISPGFFIPMAEESGFIRDIGYWVLQQACTQCLRWQKAYSWPLSISVNLSPAQFVDDGLVQQLDNIVSSTGLHPRFVDFEITESISLEKVPNLLSVLEQLNALGYSLSIDDFGTGQSSLDYIKKIPAKYLKIDQTFVRNIGLSPDDEAILEATVNMAKRMGHELVAEGVETEMQREYLAEKGCQYFQGFLFCRPLPEQKITEILEAYRKLEKGVADST